MDKNIVQRLREDRGWSLQYLGSRVGLSASALSQLERGKTKRPRLEHLEAIDRELGAGGAVLAFYGFRQRGSADIDAMLDDVAAEVLRLRSQLATRDLRLDQLERRIAALEQPGRRSGH